MPEQLLRVAAPLLLLLALQQVGGAALIHAKAWLAPVLVEEAYRRSEVAGGAAVKPWPWADTWPVARLQVPALGIERLVLAGDSGNVLAFGPGHSRASARPGAGGEVVIGGHRDTHFRFLQDLEVGQGILLQMPSGHTRRYRVSERRLVDSRRGGLQRGASEDRLLLVTCYPFDAIRSDGPLRYVVVAKPLDAPALPLQHSSWQL